MKELLLSIIGEYTSVADQVLQDAEKDRVLKGMEIAIGQKLRYGPLSEPPALRLRGSRPRHGSVNRRADLQE